MAGTSGAKILDLAVACLIVAFVLILSRTISRRQALSSVSARTLIVVASGFGLSKALVKSGASAEVRWGRWGHCGGT